MNLKLPPNRARVDCLMDASPFDISGVLLRAWLAIAANPMLLTEPAARVGIIAMEVDSVRITINVWVEPGNFLTAKIALMEKTFNEFQAAGVNFPKAG